MGYLSVRLKNPCRKFTQETKNRMVSNVPQRMRKSIGRTAYEVTPHFSSTSTENPYDKLKRIILNDCTYLK